MSWIKRVLGAVVVLALLLLAGGFLLPATYTVERSVVVHAPPERLWPLVSAPKRWREWSVWTRRDPAMKLEYSGPESGTGAAWHWTSASEGEGRATRSPRTRTSPDAIGASP